MEALSSQISLKLGQRVEVSSQQMVDCAWGKEAGSSNIGCNGGDGWLGYGELAKRKIALASEEAYPYMGASGYCPDHTVSDLGLRIREKVPCYQFKPTGAKDKTHKLIKTALYMNGPLMIYMRAGVERFVKLDESGFYSNPEECDTSTWKEPLLDHGVLLTGWIKNAKGSYLEIMNSWSTVWGDHGFGYIDENYDCGLDYMALLPAVEVVE
jgi:hypothetical protein